MHSIKLVSHRLIAGILLLSSSILYAQNANTSKITFRDIELGVSGSKDKISEICKEDKSNLSDKTCDLEKDRELMWLSYGNLQHVLGWISLGEGGSLEQVEITTDSQSLIQLAILLTEKFGKPVKVTSSVSNRIGNKFDKQTFTWIDKKGNAIIIDSIHSKIDEGRLLIISEKRLNALNIINKVVKESQKSKL